MAENGTPHSVRQLCWISNIVRSQNVQKRSAIRKVARSMTRQESGEIVVPLSSVGRQKCCKEHLNNVHGKETSEVRQKLPPAAFIRQANNPIIPNDPDNRHILTQPTATQIPIQQDN